MQEEDMGVQLLMRLIQNGEYQDTETVKTSIQKREIDFLVVNQKFEMSEYMQKLGCSLVGKNKTYEIYATGI